MEIGTEVPRYKDRFPFEICTKSKAIISNIFSKSRKKDHPLEIEWSKTWACRVMVHSPHIPTRATLTLGTQNSTQYHIPFQVFRVYIYKVFLLIIHFVSFLIQKG